MVVDQALVLGGGGVAGIAWMTGLLAGLADAGQDVTGADLVIGTSAGASVAAQLGSGLPLGDLYARQVDPALQSREIPAEVDLAKFAQDIGPYLARSDLAGGHAAALRRVRAGRQHGVGGRPAGGDRRRLPSRHVAGPPDQARRGGL